MSQIPHTPYYEEKLIAVRKIDRAGKGKKIMERIEFISYRWAEKCSFSASLPICFAAR